MVTLDMKGLHALCCLSGLCCSWPRCGSVPTPPGRHLWEVGRGAGAAALPPSPQGPPAFPEAAGFLLLQVATRILSGKCIFALGPRPAFLAERIGFGMSEWRAGACGAACLYVRAASSDFPRPLPSLEPWLPYLRLVSVLLSPLSCVCCSRRSQGTVQPKRPAPGGSMVSRGLARPPCR